MLDKRSLFKFLEVVDEELKRNITLVVAGGKLFLDTTPKVKDFWLR